MNEETRKEEEEQGSRRKEGQRMRRKKEKEIKKNLNRPGFGIWTVTWTMTLTMTLRKQSETRPVARQLYLATLKGVD